MRSSAAHKRFFSIDDIGERFGLTLIDMGVLAAEQQLRLSVPVVALPVEVGEIEEIDEGQCCSIPTGYRYLNGLVDLLPHDGWIALRNGRAVIDHLDAAPGQYVRIVGREPDLPGLEVTRDELGVRLAEWQRLEAQAAETNAPMIEVRPRQRGVQPTHNWDAFWIETCRLLFFDGVPPCQAALIRHLQTWSAAQGKKVPDESTLKRKLKPLWELVAPEARRAAS
jgi:hypothetical protein